MAVAYEVQDITPTLAMKWLNTVNTHNRNMRTGRVADYARDMRLGQWRENGDAIRFADDGTLLDGQHRLAAVVESGCTVPMLVVTGLDVAAQDTVDDGIRRTLPDVLKLRGETDVMSLAAVLRRAFLWETYPERTPRGFVKIRPTNAEALETLRRHPELRVAASEGARMAQHVALPKSTLALAHWLFYGIDESDAAEFFSQLTVADGLRKNDPVFQLRKRAFFWRQQPRREHDFIVFAHVVKAWNAYRDGTSIEVLSYRGGGSRAEPFPQPR